ncbi:DNA-binding protein [Paenibacillus sp. FSL H7-0326]|uniref:helix-turn-helix domain-containing protein n=1 Tax=Paenibacillus sp. FSL H7-0326 TaxID=1921144 RepID=UPI00096F12C7|nr:helix-turn-helix domain-containing protein [Paenibacillus sp. FSL H7-0326]OMC71327.1 DNA-binding protein [Paenibacillus sp. FSL H7-0326]
MMSVDRENQLPALFTVYSSREAAEIWGLSENTVTKWCNRGKFREDEARKSGKVWIVTHEGMERVAGRKPGD